jgi:hypothetical protein
MSKLTDLLHKLVDSAGISSLHNDIDELENDESNGEEDLTNATE